MENVKVGADCLSLGVVLSTIAGYAPAIAALFSIVWYAIRIYEWLKHKRTIE